MKAKVFISFSSDDYHYVESLMQHLDSSSVLLSTVVTRDHTPASLLAQKVAKGITEAEYFVPILSKKSIHNQWVNQEIGFASAASNIKIFPIVEEGIMNDLKGFIHNQIDLFTYQSIEPINGKSFENVIQLVKNSIENDFCASPNFIKNIVFDGVWKNKYKDLLRPEGSGEERFVIKNGFEYHILTNDGSKHYFNLCDLSVDINKKEIKFTKKAVQEDDTRAVHNILKYDSRLGIKYTGIELDKSIEIEYTKEL